MPNTTPLLISRQPHGKNDHLQHDQMIDPPTSISRLQLNQRTWLPTNQTFELRRTCVPTRPNKYARTWSNKAH